LWSNQDEQWNQKQAEAHEVRQTHERPPESEVANHCDRIAEDVLEIKTKSLDMDEGTQLNGTNEKPLSS
jgi:hypothetical protein